MMFSVLGSTQAFTIPDLWWTFCECAAFRRTIDFYTYPPELDAHTDVVPIANVEPPQRDDGVPPFIKDRMVAVLVGLQSPHGVVPPIHVCQHNQDGYRYKVLNGYHRFYGAVALGFPKIPVISSPVMYCVRP
jgi:hypothetical protein